RANTEHVVGEPTLLAYFLARINGTGDVLAGWACARKKRNRCEQQDSSEHWSPPDSTLPTLPGVPSRLAGPSNPFHLQQLSGGKHPTPIGRPRHDQVPGMRIARGRWR